MAADARVHTAPDKNNLLFLGKKNREARRALHSGKAEAVRSVPQTRSAHHSWWLSTKADMGLIWTVYVSLAEYSKRP